jgi:hypothetical protein
LENPADIKKQFEEMIRKQKKDQRHEKMHGNAYTLIVEDLSRRL